MLQLKASDSFIQIVKRVKVVRAIVLCEGKRDVEVLKVIAKRLGFLDMLRDVAVTDSEGIDTLRGTVLPSILSLMLGKVIKVKPLALIVDANKLAAEERLQAVINSLKSRGYEIHSCEKICDNVWSIRTTIAIEREPEAFAIEIVPVIIAINGIFQHPFENLEVHELEDHIAYLKFLTSRLGEEEIMRVKRASQLVTDDDLNLIENADEENIRKAFRHISCVLERLKAILKPENQVVIWRSWLRG